MGSFNKFKSAILNNEKFLLIDHVDPDGDCLGSLLAFKIFLEGLGKTVTAVCKDNIPAIFQFLPDCDKIKSDYLAGNHDAVVLLDNGDSRRTGFSERLAKIRSARIPIINIDHHTKNDLWKLASINLATENASSTAELIYDIIAGFSEVLTPNIATCLLCGIYYDTGSFKHSNTNQKVLDMASDLLSHGAKLKAISSNVLVTKSVPMLKLWGIALNRITISEKYGITSAIILKKDIEEAGASEDDVSGLVNLINAIPEAKVSLLLYETSDGKIKGSLRTEKDGVDVSKLANVLGGGGHKKAAGFMIDGKIVQDRSWWKVI
jgi:phosphoesterase RecJ-like protein